VPTQPPRRFLSLHIEHFATRLETALHPNDLTQQPVIVIRSWDDGVLDASPLAEAAGITAGDSQRRALQLCPDAVVLKARDDIYTLHQDNLHTVLDRYADSVEITGLGQFYIEVTDLARTYDNEKIFAAALIADIAKNSLLTPTVGIGANKFVAQQAARLADDPTNASHIIVVPPGGEKKFVAPLPLSVLPQLPLEVARRLHLFGIHTLADFAALPRIAVIEQFGSEIKIFHDLAKGIDPRGLDPFAPPPILTKTIAFPDPVDNLIMLLTAYEHAAKRLSGELQAHGYYTGALSTQLLTTGPELNASTSIKPPTADVDTLKRSTGRMLSQLGFDRAVLGFTLSAYPLQDWAKGARQLSFFDTPVNPAIAKLQDEIRKLQQRFGELVVRFASLLSMPLPIPIQVKTRLDGSPSVLGWGKASRFVLVIHDQWRERRRWWEPGKLIQRQYYRLECTGGLVFVVYLDHQGRWFLDRRRVHR
jgi:nucleotidyltransferase/DNA polymerase involved in DNA repair